MAGHRRQDDGTRKPLRTDARAERQRRVLVDQLGKERNPSRRVGHASDYLRKTLARLSSVEADRYATAAVQYLTDLGDQAASITGKDGR